MAIDLKKISPEIKTTMYEVEHYCNNYFNPANDPESKIRKYPDAFLELVNKIIEFKRATTDTKHVRSFTTGEVSESYNDTMSWQKAFAPELSIYKRIKFI